MKEIDIPVVGRTNRGKYDGLWEAALMAYKNGKALKYEIEPDFHNAAASIRQVLHHRMRRSEDFVGLKVHVLDRKDHLVIYFTKPEE